MNDAQVEIVSSGEESPARLVFEGELIISNISQIKRKLDTLLLQLINSELLVEIKNVTNIDLSFLQLLESLGIHLSEKGIALSLKWELDEETKTLFRQTGFEKYA